MRKGQGSIVDTKTLWAVSIFEELLVTLKILSSSVFACDSVSLVDTDSYLCQNSHVLEHQVRLANSLGVFFSASLFGVSAFKAAPFRSGFHLFCTGLSNSLVCS
jgi:hypothetical protein